MPKPGRADITSANLTPASGRQDHTTSPYAATSLVRSLGDRSQAAKPALQSRRAQNAAASTASRPAFVTIAIRPSVRRDSESSKCDLGQVGTEIFFRKTEIRLDTPVNKRPDGQIKGASRSTRDAEIPADMKHPVSAIVHCGIVSKNVARLNNPVNDAAAVAGMLTDYCDQRP